MLPKENRLKKTPEINQVFLKGKFLSRGFLSLKFFIDPAHPFRFAFSVGVSYSKKAVERNRAKRILRETVRKNSAFLPQGLDGVFFINKKKLPETTLQAEKVLASLAKTILQELTKKYLK